MYKEILSELENTHCSDKNRPFVSVKLLSLLTYRPVCLFWLVYLATLPVTHVT